MPLSSPRHHVLFPPHTRTQRITPPSIIPFIPGLAVPSRLFVCESHSHAEFVTLDRRCHGSYLGKHEAWAVWHHDVVPCLLLCVGSRCYAVCLSSASLLLVFCWPHSFPGRGVREVELGRRVGRSMNVNYHIVRCKPPNSPSPAKSTDRKTEGSPATEQTEGRQTEQTEGRQRGKTEREARQ